MRRFVGALFVAVVAGGCSSGSSSRTTAPPQDTVTLAASSTSGPSSTTGAAPATGATPTTGAAPTTMTPVATGARVPAGGPVPSGFVPTSPSFVSSKTGFLLGDTPSCATSPCTSVLRTTDAGRTWSGVPAPKAFVGQKATDGQPEVNRLAFADERNGYAFGRDLFATHDGAATWTKVGGVHSVTDLATARGVVWFVDTVGDAPHATPTLFRVPATGGTPVRALSFREGDRVGVVVSGAAVFVTSGNDGDGAHRPSLQVSDDEATFATRAVPCDADHSSGVAIAAESDHQLALVCLGEAGAGMAGKTIHTSADAGRTWVRAGDPPGINGTAIAATHKGTFIGNIRTGVDVTRDGRTWLRSLAADSASFVGFVDDDLGLVIASSGDARRLYLTRDAGAHWDVVSFS